MRRSTSRRAGRAAREAGQGALEYLAALGVAASLLISVAVAQASSDIDAWTRQVICSMLSVTGDKSCESASNPPGEEAFDPKPDRCTVTRKSEKVSSVIKIAFIEIGENAGFVETHYSDGTVAYTATDGGSIGVTAGVGAEFDYGKLEAGAKVDFGFGVEADYGSTWIFKNADEANQMREQLDDYLMEQTMLRHNPDGYWAWVLVNGATDPPRPPDQQVSTIKVEGTGGVNVGIELPWEQDKGPGSEKPKVPGFELANAGIEFGKNGTWTEVHDQRNGNTIYTTDGQVTGEAQITGGPFGTRLSGLLGSSLAITRNPDGQIIKVMITTTRKGDLSTSTKGGQKKHGGEGSDSNGDGAATVTTTTLDVKTAEQRAIVDTWLAEGGTISPETAFPESLVPNDTFQNLMYTNGKVSNVQYDNVIDKTGFAAEVKLGIAFGVDFSLETEDSKAIAATYLGTADQDGVRIPVDFPECVAK